MNNIDEYSEWTIHTAKYTGAGTGNDSELTYLALGLNGEAGEVAEKIKKRIRDETWDHQSFVKELGDVFYYLCRLCESVNVPPSEILAVNQEKLIKRLQENKIQGSGDNR